MDVEQYFHMTGGDGETSYAKNSMAKALSEAKPVLEKAIKEVYMSLRPRTMVVADLGCSSGPNALLSVSKVIDAVNDLFKKIGGHCPMEIQFFLNDLPSKDLNYVFQSLIPFEKLMSQCHKGEKLPPYYIARVSGSYYTRIFPYQSVHLFHSSYCLMRRSQVPKELSRGTYLNEGNIYIGKTTPLWMVKLYQEQFHKDFTAFLELRSKELVLGGQMVLTFLGRKNEDTLNEQTSRLLGLLAQAFQSLAEQGRVEKEKLDSFNLPYYTPSIEEVKVVINKTRLFDLSHIQLLESNWNSQDDRSVDNAVTDNVQSGAKVANAARLIAHHFGESIIDELFAIFAQNVAIYLEKENLKFAVIMLCLKSRC